MVEPNKWPLPLEVIYLGVRPYCEVWSIQKSIHQEIRDHHRSATLILCSHDPVITVGTKGAVSKSGSMASLHVSERDLSDLNIEFYQVERGGGVTVHSPSQLIAYPLLDLRRIRQDVGWYMRSLEEVVIRVLNNFGIIGQRINGLTGVWLKSEVAPYQKIASIGVKLSRWCSYHGVAIQVGTKHSGFSLIDPCGLNNVTITSITEQIGAPMNQVPINQVSVHPLSIHPLSVANTFVNCFCEVFPYQPYSQYDLKNHVNR